MKLNIIEKRPNVIDFDALAGETWFKVNEESYCDLIYFKLSSRIDVKNGSCDVNCIEFDNNYVPRLVYMPVDKKVIILNKDNIEMTVRVN